MKSQRKRFVLCLIPALFSLNTHAGQSTPSEITVPPILMKKLKSFEPSAAVNLPGTSKFLIASDDTTKKKEAMLFVMNERGEVEESPLPFAGLRTMTDIESISIEGNFLYTLSSLSRNKKGKVLPERNLFTKSQINGTELRETEAIDLRTVLLDALMQSTDPRLERLKPHLDKLMETEASFVKNSRLIIGLKDPQPRPGIATLLDLGDVNSLLENKAPPLKLEMEIDFGGTHKLSDMILSGHNLFLTSTHETGGGSLWMLDLNSQNLTELTQYDDVQPEGVSLGDREGELLVVFDQGSAKAKFQWKKLGN